MLEECRVLGLVVVRSLEMVGEVTQYRQGMHWNRKARSHVWRFRSGREVGVSVLP